jgi:ribosomal protein S18 acetylase RimI-like enzyme
VINLAVDPVARRRGVATALLRALEAELPGGAILLMVEAENRAAQALYRREGYLPTGQAADYYGPGRAGIWMEKPRPGGPDLPPKLRV